MAESWGFPRCLWQRSWASLRSALGRPLACQDLAVRIHGGFSDKKEPLAGGSDVKWRRAGDSRVASGNARGLRCAQPLAGHWPAKTLRFESMGDFQTKKSPLLGARMLNGGELGIPALPLATLVGFAALSPWQATGLPRPCGSNPWGIFRQKRAPCWGLGC